MRFSKTIAVVAAAAGLCLPGLATASTVVTLNPTANNGGAGALGTTTIFGDPLSPAGFQATGGTLSLYGKPGSPNNGQALLEISKQTGVASYLETGRLEVMTFQNGASNVTFQSGLDQPGLSSLSSYTPGYRVFIDFTLAGFGQWGNGVTLPTNVFAASLAGPTTFTANMYAVRLGGTLESATPANIIQLGSLSLRNLPTNNASVVLGNQNTAQTNFSATLDFNPAPGTTGVNGFFRAPVPFNIDINVGAVGGNAGNTIYTVNPDGSVSVRTPITGSSASTGNFTFITVPEPAALALVSLALIGAGVATRRAQKKAANLV